jgi:hypothetical protein
MKGVRRYRTPSVAPLGRHPRGLRDRVRAAHPRRPAARGGPGGGRRVERERSQIILDQARCHCLPENHSFDNVLGRFCVPPTAIIRRLRRASRTTASGSLRPQPELVLPSATRCRRSGDRSRKMDGFDLVPVLEGDWLSVLHPVVRSRFRTCGAVSLRRGRSHFEDYPTPSWIAIWCSSLDPGRVSRR